MKIFINILFYFIGLQLGIAQINISGVVKDTLGSPLELANIILIDSESVPTEHELIFRSNKDGTIPDDFHNKLVTLIKNLKSQNLKASISSLSELVPEWSSSLIRNN